MSSLAVRPAWPLPNYLPGSQVSAVEVLTDATARLCLAQSSAEVVEITLQEATRAVNARQCALFLRATPTGEAVLSGCYPPPLSLPAVRYRPGQGAVGHVIDTGEAYLEPHTRQAADVSARSLAIIPLRAPDQVLGALYVAWPRARYWHADDIRLLTALATLAANALHRLKVQNQLEQQVADLTEANARLISLDYRRNRFFTDVSYELRGPITNLVVYLSLLTQRGAESLGRYLPTLNREGQHLKNLVEELLHLARLDEGQIRLKPQTGELPQLLNEVLESAVPVAETKEVIVVREFAADLPALALDFSQMNLAFASLLRHTIARAPAGGVVTVNLQSACHKQHGGVRVSFHRSGLPIAPADLPHIYERIYRGENGLWLGLAVSKEIIERHHGTLTVESSVESGTTFSVWLPCAAAD